MRRLIALAVVAAGWSGVAAAQAPAGDIACVYSRLPPAEAEALGKGYTTDTLPPAEIATRIAPLIQACADAGAIGSQAQVQPLFEYTLLRLEADQDAAFLRANGLDPEVVERLYPTLEPAMISLLEKPHISEAEKGELSLYLVTMLSKQPAVKAAHRERASLLLYNLGKRRTREAAFTAAVGN